MRAILTLAGIIFGGVTGGYAGLKIGSYAEDSLTEQEEADFLWACKTLGMPVPDNPQNPSSEWRRQVAEKFDDLPEEKQREVRRRVKSLVDEIEGVQV